MYIVMKRNIIFSLVVFFFCLTANAQIKVRGTIVDDKNEPLIGVNIQEEGTTNGSISDVNGQYSITVAGIRFRAASRSGGSRLWRTEKK